jgi:hypothetical protein
VFDVGGILVIPTGVTVNFAGGLQAEVTQIFNCSGTGAVTINAAIAVPGAVTAIPSSSTIVFTQYPEVLVKFNQALHGYYSATGA